MSRILVQTKDMPREEWLKYRRMGIGGSDAGAIVGMNPYVTPYTVWADKTGRLPEQEDNEAMRQGRDLEWYVAARFEEATGKKLRRRNVMFQHDTLNFVTANIDREVIREKAGLECKTTSVLNLKNFKNGEFPDQYYVQCVHYLAVTGWDKWYLAVLVLNQGFYVFEIKRDEEEIAALLEAEKKFWETYVVPDMPPPMDGLPPTSKALAKVYQGGDDSILYLNQPETIRNYLQIKQQINLLEKEKELLEQQLKSDLKDCEQGECENYKITWKSQTREIFQVNRLQVDHPEIDLNPYYNSTQFRVFKVIEKKTS